jgi:hypothetical protein
MKIIKSFLTKNPCYTAERKITVKGLMLHSVGCPQPSASVFVKNWNKENYNAACVHAFVDANTGDVYQTLPWDHRGWHCGGASNNTHISVEMCEPDCIQYTGGSSFTCSNLERAREMATRTYNSAVELFAQRCKEFDLSPVVPGVIISHKEGHTMGIASNHGDPEHLWKGLGLPFTMDGFRQDVKAAMNGKFSEAGTTTASSDPVLYRVQVGAFSSREAAEAVLAKLRTEGYAAIIVSNGKEEKSGYSQGQFVKDVQAACGAAVDGVAGPETLSKTVTLSAAINARHKAVKPVQKRLNALGYTEVGEADGVAGAKFTAAVKRYQRENGCTADGEISARDKTWKKLLGMM